MQNAWQSALKICADCVWWMQRVATHIGSAVGSTQRTRSISNTGRTESAHLPFSNQSQYGGKISLPRCNACNVKSMAEWKLPDQLAAGCMCSCAHLITKFWLLQHIKAVSPHSHLSLKLHSSKSARCRHRPSLQGSNDKVTWEEIWWSVKSKLESKMIKCNMLKFNEQKQTWFIARKCKKPLPISTWTWRSKS